MTKKTVILTLLAWTALVFAGCTRHQVEIKPVEIKPIHITVDVNVKIDKELDDFFGELDEAAGEAAETKE
ncbi:MAG: hypothetical protein CSB24_04995 [Deltaproteobacteria bacterium]|nr:MAG: hypothetical protein CSB24_04995 [Deltaproteobacteria bacterium]